MHIEVEDCDPFDILSFQCDFGTDRDVVEDAVARPKVSMGVMGPSRHVPDIPHAGKRAPTQICSPP